MRNKTTIAVLLVIFAGICLFNLAMTYRAFGLTSQINNTPGGDTLLHNPEYREDFETAQRNAFSLGLDLQGGLFVTMEVGVEDLLREYAGQNAKLPEFEQALQQALTAKQNSSSSLVDLFYEQLKAVYAQKNMPVPGNSLMAKYFASKKFDIASSLTDDEVIKKLNENTASAIFSSYTIIRNRIDQFGVASPNLQLQQGAGRILLELPGVKDPDRVMSLLGTTAKLEFRETYTPQGFIPYFNRADAAVLALVSKNGASADVKPDSAAAPLDSAAQAKADSVAKADSLAQAAQPAAPAQPDSQTAQVDSNAKPDSLLSEEEQKRKWEAEHPLGALVVQTQSMDPNSPIVGYVTLANKDKVRKYLSSPEVLAVAPPSKIKFLFDAKPAEGMKLQSGEEVYALYAIVNNRDDKAPLEGNAVKNAYQDYENQNSLNPSVSMSMNSEGAATWARLTRQNVGKCIAIVMDSVVFSAPRVNGPISGGHSQITGNFTIDEAKDLANLLKAGALPVKVKVLGSTQIGPTLGAENLNKGMMSFLIGFLAVVAFMIFWYRTAGIWADVALIANLFFLLGMAAAFNVVFTLPGLAAVVLTMGMAVDANVLIFDRTREEMLLGKSVKAAIQAGFKHAFSSVMDSNITTFLTGLILFAFGIGPIRGFAVMLMLGIITSLIAALFVTRILIEWQVDKNPNLSFGSGLGMNAFRNVNVKLIERKRLFYILSGTFVTLSIISLLAFGLRTGVEFNGGRQFKVNMGTTVDVEQVRTNLNTALDNTNPLVRTVAGDTALLITTSYKHGDNNADQEVREKVLASLKATVPAANAVVAEEVKVDGTIASDIKYSAVLSVIFSILVIFVYILIRFRRPQFSVGAIASLLHDVIVVLGIYSILGYLDILPVALELDQAFIAAMLTIIGYSINDTVIVFDRVRENFTEMKSASLNKIFADSVNQTLSRTMITSGTTLLTALILLFLGGDTIRGFMFALTIGFLVGTYSSIFVASPIALDLMNAAEKKGSLDRNEAPARRKETEQA